MFLDSYYVDEVKEKLQEIGRVLTDNLILDAAINAQKAVADYYLDTSDAVMEALEDLTIEIKTKGEKIMADFNCCVRSNYFRVTDEEKLKHIIDSLEANGEIKLWDAYNENQERIFTFGCEGDIWGSDPDASNFDEDLKKIGELLPDGEALMVMQVGHEKLRYVSGIAYIITNHLRDIGLL